MKQKIQNGFTLIEVLVAMLILAGGLLGLAFLHVVSLKNNQSAQYRTDATIESYSIVDRMRINREAALAGDYDIAIGSTPPTATTLAGSDIANWKATLDSLFADGDGSIAIDGDGIVTIVVEWDDSRGTEGKTNEQLAVSVRL